MLHLGLVLTNQLVLLDIVLLIVPLCLDPIDLVELEFDDPSAEEQLLLLRLVLWIFAFLVRDLAKHQQKVLDQIGVEVLLNETEGHLLECLAALTVVLGSLFEVPFGKQLVCVDTGYKGSLLSLAVVKSLLDLALFEIGFPSIAVLLLHLTVVDFIHMLLLVLVHNQVPVDLVVAYRPDVL